VDALEPCTSFSPFTAQRVTSVFGKSLMLSLACEHKEAISQHGDSIMRIIKKVLFGIALMMLFTSSNAEWTLTATSGVLDAYVDFKDVVLEGNYAKSKRLVDYRKEQKTEKGEIYWSSISIFTYDCIKKLQQVERVRFTERMGGGVPLDEAVFTSEWEKVVAGTPNDNYMARACAGGD
jgi:hypothetical protein